MTKFLRLAIVCGAAIGLAACGGTSTPVETTDGNGQGNGQGTTRTTATIIAEADALRTPFAELIRTNNDVLDSNLSRTGSAVYNGFLGANFGSEACNSDDCRSNQVVPPAFELAGQQFGGDLTLTVNLADREVSGSATNFVNAGGAAYTGTLTMTAQPVFDTGDSDPALNAVRLTGALVEPGTKASFDISGELNGNFYSTATPAPGTVPGAVAGSFTGGVQRSDNTLQGSAGQEAGVLGTLTDGLFIATR